MAPFLPSGLPTPARFGADAVHLARGCHPDQEDGRTQADSGVMPADHRPALPIRRQGRLQPPCTPCAVRNPLSAEGHVPDGDDRRPAVAGCPPSDRLIRAGGKRIWPGAGPPRPLPHPPDRHGLVRPGRHQGKAGALFAALGMFTALSRSFARRSSRLACCGHLRDPIDGSTGDTLKACGRHAWHPSHLHFIVQAKGCRRLVTEIFPSQAPIRTKTPCSECAATS